MALNLVEEIVKLHQSMQEVLKRHGIPLEHLAFKTVNLTDSMESELIDCLAWLRAHEKHEYKSLVWAYKLVTPEMWKYYEDTETEGLQEQIILANAVSACKRAWRDRPPILRKDFNRKKATHDLNGKAPSDRSKGHRKSKKPTHPSGGEAQRTGEAASPSDSAG